MKVRWRNVRRDAVEAFLLLTLWFWIPFLLACAALKFGILSRYVDRG